MKKLNIFCYSIVIVLLFAISDCRGENVKKSVDENRDDNGDTNEDAKDESMDISDISESEHTNVTCTRRQNSLMHPVTLATSQQFPFMAAMMSNQGDYLCAGAVISNGMIITSARCTMESISYVLLNTSRARKNATAAILHVIKTEKFPTYTGAHDSLKDIGLVYTEKHNGSVASKIRLSNYTNPRDIIDFHAIGFGLNSDVNQVKELQYVGLERRSPYEYGNVIKGYIDCLDTKVKTCFKDFGGPAVLENELIGIVTSGQGECTKELTSTYAIHKEMVNLIPTYTFKSWLDEKIKKNEEQGLNTLATYPSEPVIGRHALRMRSTGIKLTSSVANIVFVTSFSFVLF